MESRVYKGFPLVMETETDGFIYGEITDHFDFTGEDQEHCTEGDGFVQAPDGSRAGIVWEVTGKPSLSVIVEPEEDRWGVYNVGFIKSIKTMADLVSNFRAILPLIKEAYNKANFNR